MVIGAIVSTEPTLNSRAAYGMPKIPSEILNSTFHLYKSECDAQKGEPFGGTGFFVGWPAALPNNCVYYALTNWHVAVRDGFSVIRLNKKNGGTEIFDLGPEQWEFIPGGPDVAVVPPSLLSIDDSIHKVTAISASLFVDQEFSSTYGIGPGEDVFMVGRFVDHDGVDTNVPSVRFGHVSVMPQSVLQPSGSTGGSFLLDVHSRSGYSGSPVFVYRTHIGDLTTLPTQINMQNHFIKLLGIHWGQFPEKWEIKESKHIGEVSVEGNEKYVEGLSGMTLAVPGWDIMKLLNTKKLKEERERLLAEFDNGG
jgi:hypothetical protein